ncbi:F-box/LRR-repeat protein 4 isoform X2 [Monomorium pharaonis]|nr:F-box/LRR-repeat protein 4 isoform X2 [Monomorium pharaonis]
MAANYQSSYYNINHYPYIDKLPILGRDINNTKVHVNFVFQFAKNSFNYQCDSINDNSGISATVHDIVGPPTNYSRYNFGIHIHTIREMQNKISSKSIDSMMLEKEQINHSYINIEYHESVYPVRISMYEKYNPGRVIRIWAKDYNNQWFLLWNETEIRITQENVGLTLFSPILRPCNFKTKMLRLEFNCSLLEKHFKLDAVMLIGTSELILPTHFDKNLLNQLRLERHIREIIVSKYKPLDFNRHENFPCFVYTHRHPNVHKHAYAKMGTNEFQEKIDEYCTFYKSNIIENLHKAELAHRKVSQDIIPNFLQFVKRVYKNPLFNDYSNYKKLMENIESLWDNSNELPRCSLSDLSDEIILEILKNLDFKSLCRVSKVNKRLNNLSWDSSLYESLNVRNIHFTYWRFEISHIFNYFAPRCKYLTQLDLSFCNFFAADFIEFLNNCGNLTDLRLISCQSIDNFVVLKISEICIKLKVLDLSNCNLIKDEGFSHLEKLKFLECLHLQEIKNLKTETLCKILQNNQHIHELNLAYNKNLNLDAVALELKTSCPNLEKINLRMTNTLTSQGIDALASCKKLQEVIFGFIKMPNISDLQNSFDKLFSCCQRLKAIDLSNFLGSIPDLETKSLLVKCNLKFLLDLPLLKVSNRFTFYVLNIYDWISLYL